MNSENLLIDRSTTIKTLLDVDQEAVIAALIQLNKNFSKLKNPVLRKLLTKRVSVSDACKVAGCTIADFLRSMEAIGFKQKSADEELAVCDVSSFKLPPLDLIIDFDVRPILAEHKDPLKEILDKIKYLKLGECLKIINTFEPTPLITLLKRKGFDAYTEQVNPDLVITYFCHSINEPDLPEINMPLNTTLNFDEMVLGFKDNLHTIDVTDLEMPLPMHTILDALGQISMGEALFVHHKKVPVYLLPHLKERGYEYVIKEDEGKVLMLIYEP